MSQELMDLDTLPWRRVLKQAVELYIQQCGVSAPGGLDPSHTNDTPDRVVRAFEEYAEGYDQDPAEPLTKIFTNKLTFDQMVHVERIQVISRCAHHLEPIVGVGHFAYIPNQQVVGLSKIPRFITMLASRLQVQENLTDEVVDLFMRKVVPQGCAFHLRAYHFCMLARGVREHDAFTTTTALRGCFHDHPTTKAEFLNSISRDSAILG